MNLKKKEERENQTAMDFTLPTNYKQKGRHVDPKIVDFS